LSVASITNQSRWTSCPLAEKVFMMNPKKKNALMAVLRNATLFADATLLCVFSQSKTGEPKIIMFSMTWSQLSGRLGETHFRNKPDGKTSLGSRCFFDKLPFVFASS